MQGSITHLPKKYKTVKLQKKGAKFAIAKFPPTLEPNTMVLKPFLIGVCRSDLKELAGTRKTRRDFGHEFVARVEWTNVKNSFSVGEVVILDPHIPIVRDTGFSELIVASGKTTDLIRAFHKINPQANYKKMILTEPTACAYHCISRLRIYLGQRRLDGLSVAIVGAGTFGTLIGLLAKHYGASVTIYNRSQEKLDFLEKRDLFKKSELKTFQDTKKTGYDVVIPTTSFLFPEVMTQSTKLVKKEGLVLLFGGTSPGDMLQESEVNIDEIRRQEKIDRIFYANKFFRIAGSYGARTEDFKQAVIKLEDKTVDLPVEKMINQEVPFENIMELFSQMQKETTMGKNILLVNN